MACCSQLVCLGCDYTNQWLEFREKRPHLCPFCRHPRPNGLEAFRKCQEKRIAVNDPAAICSEAKHRFFEDKDYKGAVDLYNKAAKLGDAEAHYELSLLYREGGKGVARDKIKEIKHLEKAAIAGHASARFNLAANEMEKGGPFVRVLKHREIAAKLGHLRAMEAIERGYSLGHVSKEYFEAVRRVHQDTIDAAKSPQRKVAWENEESAKMIHPML